MDFLLVEQSIDILYIVVSTMNDDAIVMVAVLEGNCIRPMGSCVWTGKRIPSNRVAIIMEKRL